jgi:hypothetical protein
MLKNAWEEETKTHKETVTEDNVAEVVGYDDWYSYSTYCTNEGDKLV